MRPYFKLDHLKMSFWNAPHTEIGDFWFTNINGLDVADK